MTRRDSDASEVEATDSPAIINPKGSAGRTAVHRACAKGDMAALTALVQSGFPLTDVDDLGASPIHIAARHGRMNCLITLLDAGVDIDLRDKDGRSVVHEAVDGIGTKGASTDCLGTLLQRKANPNTSDRFGRTPLTLAMDKISDADLRHSVVGTLLGAGAHPDGSKQFHGKNALVEAARAGDMALVELFLANGAAPSSIKNVDDPALIAALLSRDEEIVNRLLDEGAQPHREALRLAIRQGSSDLVRRLTNAGAPTFGMLHDAARTGCLEIVNILLNAGERNNVWLDADLSGEEGVTARDVAANSTIRERLRSIMVASRPTPKRRHLLPERLTGLAKRLVSDGVDSPLIPRSHDTHRQSPLAEAVKSGNPEAVALLIEFGAKLAEEPCWDEWADESVKPLTRKAMTASAQDWRGADAPNEPQSRSLARFALGCADPHGGIRWSQLDEDKALEASRAQPANAHYIDAMTPLHFAAANDMPRVIVDLVGRGAHLAKRTQLGETPLHFAAKCAGAETVRVLVNAGANLEASARTPLAAAAEAGNVQAIQALLEAGANPNPATRL